MIDYSAARSLVKLPPDVFIGRLAKGEAGGFSCRAGLLLRQRLRAIKNDVTLPVDVRGLAEKLWRRSCRVEQSKKQSGEAKRMLSCQATNETRTPKVRNVDEVDPLVELLPSLLAYERKEIAEQAWLKKHGPLQNSDWSLGTCDSCGRNDLVCQRLTPTGLHWLDFACYQGVDKLWEAAGDQAAEVR